jgi:PAS domain S-box-containing protein/putative nucleotidyltransferase with HDIG domain
MTVEDDQLQQMTDALLDTLPLGVILTDVNGDIAFINHTAEAIRNIRRENLIGKNMLDCHAPRSQAGVMRALENIRQKPDTTYKRMVEDSASGKYYINTYAGIVDAKNEAIGLAVLTEDVTEKRKLELERSKTYQMNLETMSNIRKQYHELLLTSLETIAKILEARDPYTRHHSKNVCDISLKLYEHRKGIGEDYHMLKTAATLHDIGKICIPDAILFKPGPLSDLEFSTIRQHSAIAAEILKPLDSGSAISSIVRHHHEHYDGRGYPDGLRGGEIPMCSRIITIADAFDAMRSDRPYRRALPFQRCVDEIARNAGAHFDPEWVEVFLELTKTGSL